MNSLTVAIHQFTSNVDDLHAKFAEQHGLSVLAMLILNQLYKEDCVLASALARSVGKAATSFTPILDRLQEADFITRQLHPTDRRAILISLTTKGESLRKDITAHMEQAEGWLTSELYKRIKLPLSPTLDTLFAPLPKTQAS